MPLLRAAECFRKLLLSSSYEHGELFIASVVLSEVSMLALATVAHGKMHVVQIVDSKT